MNDDVFADRIARQLAGRAHRRPLLAGLIAGAVTTLVGADAASGADAAGAKVSRSRRSRSCRTDRGCGFGETCAKGRCRRTTGFAARNERCRWDADCATDGGPVVCQPGYPCGGGTGECRSAKECRLAPRCLGAAGASCEDDCACGDGLSCQHGSCRTTPRSVALLGICETTADCATDQGPAVCLLAPEGCGLWGCVAGGAAGVPDCTTPNLCMGSYDAASDTGAPCRNDCECAPVLTCQSGRCRSATAT